MSSDVKPTVVLIGTGGTIASRGAHPLELTGYIARNERDSVHELMQRFVSVHDVANVIAVDYINFGSHNIVAQQWIELVRRIHSLAEEHPSACGIVITHGTASLEETAYFLNLTVKVPIPVVLVGAQRPATGLSTDAGLNLVNALRVAGSPASKGRGVLVMLNDEIHAAREVTKTSTLRLQTFRSPDFGVLGHADADQVVYYRRSERKGAPIPHLMCQL